jgi:glycosyltransferase involved in cell wall biosynthesis
MPIQAFRGEINGMHIVHVVQLYHPVASGSVRYFVEIGKRLAAAGHRVTVLTTTAHDLESLWQSDKRTFAPGYECHEGCDVYRFPIKRISDTPLVYPILRRLLLEAGWVGLPLSLLRWLAVLTPQASQLTAWVATNAADIDVIHMTNVTLDGLLHPVMQIARAKQIPVITTPFVHLGDAQDRNFVRYYSMPQQLDLLNHSRDVITMTGREARFLQSREVTQPRFHVVGAGVTPAEVTGGDGVAFRARHAITGPIVLQVGAMARDKGTITTVQAMELLWAAGSDVTLVLIGAPLAHFQQFYDQLPTATTAHIRILAYASDAERRDAYAAAHMLVLPSRTDSFGIVFLEAWCNQLPVIGADAGGIPDLVQADVDGLLVPFGDVDSLAQAIQRLLSNPDLAHQFGTAGYAKVHAHYTWEHIYTAVAPIYQLPELSNAD